MDQVFDLVDGVQLGPVAIIDIVLTAVLIYGVFSLIQGTRAVRLVIGAIILFLVFVVAQALDLVLLSSILQAGVVVGLVALVVIFQPELRRGLDRLGRVGSWGWFGPSESASYQRVAGMISASAAKLSRRRAGALIVVERDTGLGDMAETGVAIGAQLSADLLTSIFAPGYPLHDGAVIVSRDRIIAAGVMLPLADRPATLERYGTRHRAALGVTEQTDALAIVVSEESGAISLAEGGRMDPELDEDELRQRLYSLLSPPDVAARARSMTAGRGGQGEGSVTEGPPSSGADATAAPSDDVPGADADRPTLDKPTADQPNPDKPGAPKAARPDGVATLGRSR